VEKRQQGNCLGWRKDSKGIVRGGEKTARELSRVEKRQQGNCLGWRKGTVQGGEKIRRELSGEKMGRDLSGLEKRQQGNCLGWRKDGKGIV